MFNFKNKKLIIVPILIMVIFVFTACSNTSEIDNTTTSNLRVKVLDQNGASIKADVTLNDSENNEIESKTGENISFENLKSGKYTLVASRNDGKMKEEKSIVLGTEDQVEKVIFENFAGANSVEKYVFSSDENKKITMKNFKEGEEAIIGITPLNFDPTDNTSYSLSLGVERGEISKSNLVSSKTTIEDKNPEYIYNEPPKIDLPKINNRDEKLRKMEDKLLSERVKEELPTMDPNEYDKGDKVGIWVDNPDGSWSEVQTTVRGVGDHSYILVDDSMDFITDEMVQNYVDEFDNKIYDNNTEFYAQGHDIDQNDKVMITLIDMGGPQNGAITMGYFWGKDFYSQEQLNNLGYKGKLYSNEADIIYLNGMALEHGFSAEDHLSTIAHEFQHLQWYYNNWEKDAWHSDTWINEGMSTYAEQLNGYSEVDGRIYCYFDNGYTQLDDLSQASLFYWDQTLADYGLSNLFTNYLTEQYGENIINNIYNGVTADKSPMDIVESTSNKDMTDIFMNFIVANKLHSLNLSSKYSYELPLEGDPVHTSVTSQYSGLTPEIKNSGVKYYKIKGTGKDVELEINGSITDKKVGAFIYRY